MNKIVALLAAGALAALLAVPAATADIGTSTTDLGTVTTLTSDQIDALGIPWDASLEDWSTALDPPTFQCTGVLPPGTYGDVTVPPGDTCIINASNIITHDLTVLQGARLMDRGAYIGHDVRANSPASMDMGGVPNGPPGTVGHDIHIQGTTGPGSTSVVNLVCNQQVGHDIVVQKSLGTATAWLIGDPGQAVFGGDFYGCGNNVAHDLVVKDNANSVDVTGNRVGAYNNTGAPAGIGHDLRVENNSGGATVNLNSAGHDCTQSNNSPYSGNGNTAGNNNNCNTTY